MRAWMMMVLAAGCAGAPSIGADSNDIDLPLGDRLPDDKADGNWGAALTCKTLPTLPALPHPEIVVSLYGQSVHLIDRSTGFDKVFAAGVGAIDGDQTNSTYGDSLSYYPIIATGGTKFTLKTANIQSCKTWWTDPETGEKSPVFAGLPFMPWYGGYAFHGPIDNFRAANGGNLRRGFVSHGCIRMEAADVSELYARIHSAGSVPVTVQREPERTTDGVRVDVAQRWLGAECAVDGDCNYPGGVCRLNPVGGRGFCTARCTTSCADRAGAPTSYCAADATTPGSGWCMLKVAPQNPDCRSYDHLVSTQVARPKATLKVAVCAPGSRGWVGDRCRAQADCTAGTTCNGVSDGKEGVCTIGCTRYCADQPGYPATFCADDAELGDVCVRTCTPASNASECPAEHDCVARSRPDKSSTRWVCIPR